MTTLNDIETQKVYTINQEIMDIVGASDKDAFTELMTANNPLHAIKFAYKMICKTRNLTPQLYFLEL